MSDQQAEGRVFPKERSSHAGAYVPAFIRHHWRAVFFLASFFVVLLAFCPPLAQGLENLSVKVVTALCPDGESRAATVFCPDAGLADAAGADPQAPVVVLIDDDFHEKVFKQRSPLDRRALQQLIEKLIELEPDLLVIDLDLSPSPPLVADDPVDKELEAAERKLLESLERLLKQRNKLVLATPSAVSDKDLALRARDWMDGLCKTGNVRFGYPLLHESSGVVVRYDKDAATLANVAATFEKKRFADDPCDVVSRSVRDGDLNRAFFLHSTRSNGIEIAPKLDASSPINDNFYSKHREFKLANVEGIEELRGEIKKKVVFLGGAYGHGDRYLTTAGEHVGVTVHAAAYYSTLKPLWHSPALDFVLELAFGFIVAVLFHWSFCQFFRYRYIAAYYRTGDLATKSRARRIIGKTVSSLALVCITAVSVVAVVLASAWLWKSHTWLNPAPFLIGIVLKALFSAHEETIEAVKTSFARARSAAASDNEEAKRSEDDAATMSAKEREDIEKRKRFASGWTLVMFGAALGIIFFKGH